MAAMSRPPSGDPPPTDPPHTRPAAGTLSIADFMTDGALARLCGELSELAGAPVTLRDAHGRRIWPAPDATPPWRIAEDGPGGPAPAAVPILAGGKRIGWFDLPPGAEGLRPALELLASTVTEVCDIQLELRHRVEEISALYRLSSLLAAAGGVDEIIGIGLESALDVLGLDAGSIMLLKERADGILSEDEEDLELKVSRGLSDWWLSSPAPLSRQRIFDRMALKGEVVVSEDLVRDERVSIAEDVRREGLVSAIHAGLVFQGRPLGVLRAYSKRPRTFTGGDRRLITSIGQQLAVAVEQARLLEIQREERRIQRQLQLAADVQRRMLPPETPRVAPFDLAGRWSPSLELAGDFYDYLEVGGKLGLVVGDVVGKGVAAALLMASVRASLRAHCDGSRPVHEVIERVNRDMCRDTLSEEFATVWFGVADPRTLELTWCSAGHDPPLLASRGGDGPEIIELSGGGLIVGVDPEQRYESRTQALRPGDVLFLYTDGVPDARNFQGERFGRVRLREALATAAGEDPSATAAGVLDRFRRELRQFIGLAPSPDDRTMVVLSVG